MQPTERLVRDSIVLELQRHATDKEHAVDELLRKALVVATKLKIDDFRNWIESELNGYISQNAAPEYRRVHAEIRAFNPYRGYIPVVFHDDETGDLFCSMKCTQPIGSLTGLLDSDDPEFGMPLTPKERNWLCSHSPDAHRMQPLRFISRTFVIQILDAVRNMILDWALRLEASGILGDGMSFSKEEKDIAARSNSIEIGNFQGVFGNVSGSTFDLDQSIDVQMNDFDSLRRFLLEKGVHETDISELEDALIADADHDTSEFGSAVSLWIGNMVAKAASGGWDVSIGAAGSLLADAIHAYFGS